LDDDERGWLDADSLQVWNITATGERSWVMILQVVGMLFSDEREASVRSFY
jgi:hypothetical protein